MTRPHKSIVLSIVVLALAVGLSGCSRGPHTGDTTRESCTERYWDDQDGDGWGECISEEEMHSGFVYVPQVDEPCDGSDSCYQSDTDDSGDWGNDDSYEEDFDPYWNGREMVECPGDYWGDEPCG